MSSRRVVIQLIHTQWTKASRGGDGARLRNALPRQLPLPLESFAAPVTLHRVAFSEFTNFERRETVDRADSPSALALRDLRLAFEGDQLAVKHVRDRQNAAIADRLYPDESGNTVWELDAFVLAPDDWGQLHYNGRYVDMDTGNWWYEQSVYNIGLFTGVVVDRFTSTKPDFRFAELATLY
jgi:hypothetical protein